MVDDKALKAWFCGEVLPLEPVLTRFIRRHCRNPHEVADIRQEVYEKLLAAAARALPIQASAYVFTIVRNVMINRARRANVISIELMASLDEVVPDADWLTPDRYVDGRQELLRVQAGLDRLPPRCRQVIWLRKVEGLSTREVAERLGVGIDAVEQQTTLGMRALIDFMLGGEGRIKRPPRAAWRTKGKRS
jgi:RNA polymerase sigma-70 factor (ECF subfamily)